MRTRPGRRIIHFAAMNVLAAHLAPSTLAGLATARICHDLVSPLGAIGNGIELMQMTGAQGADQGELALVVDSLDALRSRIATFRMAFGPAGSEHRISHGEIAALVADAGAERLTVELAAEGDLPRSDAKLILLALMCIETALPWGGRLLICRTPHGWRLVAEASRTRPDPALWSWLDAPQDATRRPPPAPAEVQFPLLAEEAAARGRALHWEVDDRGAEIAF